ncbi:autotransporter outer membrane beta-barrel domain-containing protein [Bartonella krasnovii]|uniref:autotransporter family protein n=1 Tax=Bartonella krasnovii TaxID=2267275 RepID=UPI001F4C9F37|nr:autotransporter outer membrane beta-barrel domain-containing protein [Bartonella krasnovii]UNF41777.1 autotransporter outer membrane beta-barrel domain-containing protein [Bartonella krasnovii]
MINVVKNRARLCALTTSAFVFLQGAGASVGASSWFSSVSSLGGLTSYLPSIPGASSFQSFLPTNGGTSGDEVAQLPSPSPLVAGPQAGSGSYGGVPGGVPGGAPGGVTGGVTARCTWSKESPASAPIVCNDGETHTLAKSEGEGQLQLKTARKYDSAIYVSGPSSTVLKVSGVSILAEDGAGGRSDVNHIENRQVQMGGMGSVFVDGKDELGAQINLTDSSVQGFVFGLGASRLGKISMSGGFLENDYVEAVASEGGAILLSDTSVSVKTIGLWSDSKSLVSMQGGNLGFHDNGVGVISSEMGIVLLDRVKINEASKSQSRNPRQIGSTQVDSTQRQGSEVVDGLDDHEDLIQDIGRTVLMSRGGYISFNNGNVNIPNAAFLQIGAKLQNDFDQNIEEYIGTLSSNSQDSKDSEAVERLKNINGIFGNIDAGFLRVAAKVEDGFEKTIGKGGFKQIVGNGGFIYFKPSERSDLSSSLPLVDPDVLSKISSKEGDDNFARVLNGVASDLFNIMNQKKEFLGSKALFGSLNLDATIKSSFIVVPGKRSYGIYFDNTVGIQHRNVLEKPQSKREPSDENEELHAVLLQNTHLRVPEGIAVYSNGFSADVFVQDKSTVAGRLLLKAEESADLSLFVHNSVISGATRFDEDSHARIFLSNGSRWSVVKGLEGTDPHCIDSCISSVILKDSSIMFSPPRRHVSSRENQSSGTVTKYRTLRIGEGKGTVYSAEGDSVIQFNVDVSGTNSGQISDRLLIHGDVSGITKVKVKAHTVGWHRDPQNKYSIPLIQVVGRAESNSFSLDDDRFISKKNYVTLGTPYQYVLRAYHSDYPPASITSTDSPDSSVKIQPFDTSLMEGARQIWDFRLEDARLPFRTSTRLPVRTRVGSADVASGDLQSSDLSRVQATGAERGDLPATENASSDTPAVSGNPETEEPNRGVNSGAAGNPASLGRSDSESDMDLTPVSGEASGINSGPTGGVPSTSIGEGESNILVGEQDRDDSSYIQGLGDGYSSYDGLETSDGVDIYRLVNPSPPRGHEVEYTIEGGLEGESSVTTDRNGDSGDTVTDTELTTPQTVESSVPSPTTSSGDSDMSQEGATSEPVGSETSETVTTSATTPLVPSAASAGRARSGASDTILYTLSGTYPSFRSRNLLSIPSGTGSAARSDSGETSVISTDGISVSSGRTISNSLPSIKSAASVRSSASEVSEKSVSPSNRVNPSASEKSVALSSEIKSSTSSNGPVGRILSANSAAEAAVSSTCVDMQKNGESGSQTSYLCSDGQSHTITGKILKASDNTQHSMHAKSPSTVIKLDTATIIGAGDDNKNNIDLTTLQAISAVLAEEKAEVVLDKKSIIQSSVIGLEAKGGGKVKMTDGTVSARYVGALADSGSSIDLKDTKINLTGALAVAGLASKGGTITMNSGVITQAKGVAVRSESGGSVKLDKVDITVKKEAEKSDSEENFGRAAFLLNDNASIDFKNGNVVTDAHVLWVMNSGDADVVEKSSSRIRRSSEVRPAVNQEKRPAMNHANIESSTIKVEGDGAYGIYFDGVTQKEGSRQESVVKQSAVSQQEKTPIHVTGAISLKKTNFEVAKGIAIYGNNSGGHVSLANKTTLAGDLLLKAENNSNISVSIDNSIVKGGVRVNKDSYAKLDLINGSEWILKRSTQKDLGTPDSRCVDSCVSSVRLVNSAIDFASPESGEKYQTLHIGNGKGTVYEVQGDVVIHLNARLNPHDSSSQQVTDQLVIHGDVSGKTKIHVRGEAGNVGNGQKNAKIAHSVSVIQVYGQAEKDSFQLDGDYVALRNSPYKYTLRSYSPEVTSAEQHVQQKFVKDGGAFWNFRLENQYVKSAGSAALSERFVRSVVPQVPTYLVLPNSVFHTGLMDINNQNKQLETLRMTSTGMVEVRENPALYLRGYGGSYRYASDLSALEYGYDGDLDYRGVEAGVLLKTIENTDSALSFGVMGTYGKLSLKPLDVEQSQKSAFDKWTATVYGSMQHNVGFYVDGLLSYGLFKGDVLTLARGKTATLKGNPLNVSLVGGQTIATGYKGFVFDPQVQVVYQHLQFNKARDIDNFDIEMGNLDQWVARVGGRLTKNPTGSEGVNAVAFYGKLYLAHGFGEKQSVHFSDSFKLGAFGSSLEAGVGFNAKLLPQFSLHADILYQHKLNKAGFSGASFSGGVRYQF